MVAIPSGLTSSPWPAPRLTRWRPLIPRSTSECAYPNVCLSRRCSAYPLLRKGLRAKGVGRCGRGTRRIHSFERRHEGRRLRSWIAGQPPRRLTDTPANRQTDRSRRSGLPVRTARGTRRRQPRRSCRCPARGSASTTVRLRRSPAGSALLSFRTGIRRGAGFRRCPHRDSAGGRADSTPRTEGTTRPSPDSRGLVLRALPRRVITVVVSDATS